MTPDQAQAMHDTGTRSTKPPERCFTHAPECAIDCGPEQGIARPLLDDCNDCLAIRGGGEGVRQAILGDA